MNQRYDHTYRPPIPVLSLRLYSSAGDTFSDLLTALVDTGSDASLIPQRLLIEIGAEETAPGWLVSITGDRKPIALYFVDVIINNATLAGIRVIEDPDADDVIMGRDVLNKLPLFLDGPQATLTIFDERTAGRLRQD